MKTQQIPFNWPHLTGHELERIAAAHAQGRLAGDGPFTRQCHQWLEQKTGSAKALLTHSCTAALEMAALLLELGPGDEVIVPSFTFVSTANAFVLRGAVPVFVDVRPDTLNLDENLIEAAITPRTRAIVVVHYAGVACEMDTILALARRHHLAVVEDAAQGVMATYKGRPLGAIGELGAYSFHETKNLISGEGGCLLVNRPEFAARAEVIREKGTDRSRFFRGEVDKYTWQDLGSSFLPGELTAAFLSAQLDHAEAITSRRRQAWAFYHQALAGLENAGRLRRPIVPEHCRHNAHLYYVLLAAGVDRDQVLSGFRRHDVWPMFHYVPLHSSPAGRKFGRTSGALAVTDTVAQQLIRLPLWTGIAEEQQQRVVDLMHQLLG